MHASKRRRTIRGRGPEDKAIVFGLLDRETGEARTMVVRNRRKHQLQDEIRNNVEPGCELYTDALKSCDGLSEYAHKVIDHAEAYVDGNVHTNRLENFWSLLK
jgi:transposase-like protein